MSIQSVKKVSILIIDGGSYRIRDNTALINAIESVDMDNGSKLLPVFVIHPSLRLKSNQKQLRFVVEIMRDINTKFAEFDIHLHCFCKDITTIIKHISESVSIKDIFINKSYNYPEKLNTRDLEMISESFGFDLICSNDALLINKSELYVASPDIVCTDIISRDNMKLDEYRSRYIDKKSTDYVNVRKPDRRDYFELFDTYSNVFIKNTKLFKEELNIPKILSQKSYQISSKIWEDLIKISNRNRIQPIEYFRAITINGSRHYAAKLLKSLSVEQSHNDYMLNAYIRYGILSVREIYHKLNKLYENFYNSPTMLYLTHRDYIFNTIDDAMQKCEHKINNSSETKINSDVFISANTDNIIVNCGIRQMMIQGILNPHIRTYMYNYFKIHDEKYCSDAYKIYEKYFMSLIDFDDLIDEIITKMNKTNTDGDVQNYIKAKNLQSYIDTWNI